MIVAIAGGGPAEARSRAASLQSKARERVSQQQDIPMRRLSVGYHATSVLRYSGRELVDLKVRSKDGRVFGVSFDASSGDVVNRADAQRREDKSRRAAIGKEDAQLHAKLSTSGSKP